MMKKRNPLFDVMYEQIREMEKGSYKKLFSEIREKLYEHAIAREDQDEVLLGICLQEMMGALADDRDYLDEEYAHKLTDMFLDPSLMMDELYEQADLDSFGVVDGPTYEPDDVPEELWEVLIDRYDDEEGLELLCEDLEIPYTGDPMRDTKAAAKKMLSAKVLREHMLVMHDESLNALQTLVSGGQVSDEERIFSIWTELLDYCFSTEIGYLRMTKDVREAFAAMDTQEFNDEREQVTWLHDCVLVFAMYYGLGSVETLMNLYNTSSVWHVNSEQEIMDLLKKLPEPFQVLKKNKGGLCHEFMKDSREVYNSVKDSHKDFPEPYPAERRDIEMIGCYGYPKENPYYRAMKDMVSSLMVVEDRIEEFMMTLYNGLSINMNQEMFLDLLEEYLVIPERPEDMQELMLLYVMANNHTHKMLLNGRTPEYTKQIDDPHEYIEGIARTPQGIRQLQHLREKYKDLDHAIIAEEQNSKKS